MRRKPALTPEEKEKILQLRQTTKLSASRIAERIGVHHDAVIRWLKESDLYSSSKKGYLSASVLPLDVVAERYHKGESLSSLATEYDVEYKNLHKALLREGLIERTQGRYDVSPFEFVQAWQESEDINEVIAKLGMDKYSALSRAAYYKRKGIPLKKLRRAQSVDWDDLKEFANLFLPQDD